MFFCFLFSSNWKLMQIVVLAAPLFFCVSFFSSHWKLMLDALLAGTYPFCGGFFFKSDWKLKQNGLLVFLLLSWFQCQILVWWPSSFCGRFGISSFSKLISNALLAVLLFSWRFLFQFSLKTDGKCSSGGPPSSCGGFLCNSIEISCQVLWWRPPSLIFIQSSLKNLCQILFWRPWSSCGGFFFNSL